jgi:protein-disulfide isomerase
MTKTTRARGRALILASLLLGAPAFAQPATPHPLPTPVRTADVEALENWLAAFFAWGDGQAKLEDVPIGIPSYHLYRATKTFAADSRLNDQCFAAAEDGGKWAIVGDVFVDEERAKARPPLPVRTDADLEGIRERLKKYLRVPFRLALDPALDRRSWKGLRLKLDTGYGDAEIPAYLKADDGAFMMLGRVWDRKRTVAEQRRELMKLDATPVTGPLDAKVTIVEYSDMECGFCKKRTLDWEPLTEKLAPILKIKRYIKNFPLTSEHPWAFRAASAGRCFFETDPKLYFRWKAQVYQQQEHLSIAAVDTFALDFAAANNVSDAGFKACYLGPKSVPRILADIAEGYTVRVRATPTYFVDGVLVSWFSDDLMEEFLRKFYLKGAGLPLPTRPRPTGTPGHAR